MLRSALFLLSGNSFASLLNLVRSLVISHLISVTDFGIASTFTLAISIIEMVSAIGVQQQIVQHRDGDEPRFQDTLHGMQGIRAIVNGALLFVLSGLIADFFKVPEAAWAYRVMALVSLIGGFMHLDPHRLNRRMNFRASMAVSVLGALVPLVLAWPLSRIFTDYSLMVYIVLIQCIIIVIVSHLLAERPYRWAFDREVMRESMRFGWPVILNAILLFLVFNGERLIVGRELGMEPLAVFSMAFTLVLAPTIVLEGSAQSFLLPQLSAARRNAETFRHLAMAALQVNVVFASLFLVGTAILGGPVVHLLLGHKYADALPILTWLAILQGIRLSKGGSSAITVAHGITTIGFVASLVRAALLPLAWYVTTIGGDMLEVIWLGTLGELIGFAASLWMARSRLDLSMRPFLVQLVPAALLFAVGALHALGQSSAGGPVVSPLLTGAALIGLLVLVVLTARDLRLYVRRRAVLIEG